MMRRLTALYLTAFFSLTLAVRHEHRNALADLCSDGASNSGHFIQPAHPAPPVSGLSAALLVEDESCLACFFSDVTAAESAVLGPPDRLPIFRLPGLSSSSAPAPVDLPAPADRGPPLL